jgi:hypothetical protein
MGGLDVGGECHICIIRRAGSSKDKMLGKVVADSICVGGGGMSGTYGEGDADREFGVDLDELHHDLASENTGVATLETT